MSIPTEAEQTALRHGRWTCVIFIVGCVVLLVRIVPNPAVTTAESSLSDLLAVTRPWTTIVVAAFDLWAVVLACLLVRHRRALGTSRARNAFLKASSVMALLSVLPSIFIWGWYGLPATVVCAVCFVATLVLARRARAATDA